MSEENVALAHRTVDAFNRRDLDALLALMDDDVEAFPPLASMEGAYHGHAGIRRWWESLLDTLPDFAIEVVEVRDSDDLTVGTLRNRAHVAASDTAVEQRLWLVAKWHEGKTVWWRAYQIEAEALKAAGLSE
jgi:ketosteroid isomerase-like protein